MDDQQLQDYYNMAVAEVVRLYKGYPKGENNVNLLYSCIKEYNTKHPSVNDPKLNLETDTNVVRIVFLGGGDLNERLKKLLSDDKLVFFNLDEAKKATETSLLKGGRKSRRGKRNSKRRSLKKRRGSSKKRN